MLSSLSFLAVAHVVAGDVVLEDPPLLRILDEEPGHNQVCPSGVGPSIDLDLNIGILEREDRFFMGDQDSKSATFGDLFSPGDFGYGEGAIITNGRIILGVTPEGALNVPGEQETGSLDGSESTTAVGLRYVFDDGTQGEATSYGCTWEGWGASFDNSQVLHFNTAETPSTLHPDNWASSFESDESTAVSVVVYGDGVEDVNDEGAMYRVTHDFHPSEDSDNLYELDVTLENLANETVEELLYRRVLDWDVYPSPFQECVTISDPTDVEYIDQASNDAFISADPLAPFVSLEDLTKELEFWELREEGSTPPLDMVGPKDQGAAFQFSFPSLAVGESFSFKIFYGAAETVADAEDALRAVGAEAYSLATPSSVQSCEDGPNVYVIGFAGVGGQPIIPDPIVPEETVTITGRLSTNKEICSMTEDERALFVDAAETTIGGFVCPETGSCEAAIQSACGQDFGGSRSRNLQAGGNWQVNYEVTETFTCADPTCASAADLAAIEAARDRVAVVMANAIDSGALVTVLSENILNVGGLDAALVACLHVWGIVEEEAVGQVSEGAADGAAGGAGNPFYPDWVFNSGTCLSDGNQPNYMNKTATLWLSDTLESCCSRFFPGWNLNMCLSIQGTRLWYVSHSEKKCVTDCSEDSGGTCGGIANPISDDLYTNPRDCCKNELLYRFLESCEADSLNSDCYGGTGLFYRGDAAGSKVCVRDCDPAVDATCGGIVEDSYVVLHDTAEACCSAEYGWINNQLCTARTTQTPLEMYWPDMTNAVCIKDSETEAENLDVSVYSSAAECCREKIQWAEAECISASNGTATDDQGTNKYYVDWVLSVCVKDCVGPAPCGPNEPTEQAMYDNVSECCDRISWVPRSECVLN